MKYLNILLSLFLCLPVGLVSVCAQTSPLTTTGGSFRLEHTYLDASTEASCVRLATDITYLDGFGRPLQVINVNACPDGLSDLIQPYLYGQGGRMERQYLPYTRTNNNGAFISDPLLPSNWSLYDPGDQTYPYTLNRYDLFNRIYRQTPPGSSWHTSNRSITNTYGYNASGEVRLYDVDTTGNLQYRGTYPPGCLQKQTVTDEDGHTTYTYTNNNDQILLTVQANGSELLQTYNVYDDFGQLRWVLSPAASVQLGIGTDPQILSRLAYRYDYDLRGLLILKSLPSCAPIYYVYDAKDRLVLSQDGNQRTSSCWSYVVYDSQNRAIQTGEVLLPGQDHVSLRTQAGNSQDYTPSGTMTPLSYTVYDAYTATPVSPVHPFLATSSYSTSFHPHVTGLPTGVSNRLLGTNSWHTTTYYYDSRSRIIQTVTNNRLGSLSRTDLKYDFPGNPISCRESHGKSGASPDIFESQISYDHRGRILSTSFQLNGGSVARLRYAYDPLGRTSAILYGDAYFSRHTYNIRNWLTGIYNPQFDLRLRYQNPETGIPCYNGNISELEWYQATFAVQQYNLTYDAFNRLQNSDHKTKTGTTWLASPSSYAEKGLSYDPNGNLLTLQRTCGGILSDNLTYTYTGNQLTGLTESCPNALPGDIYAPGASAVGTYTYDSNGNLINDSRRSLLFNYNSLNLLNEIRNGSTIQAGYTYLSDGTKLGVIDGAGALGFEYVGSLVYRRDAGGLHLSEALFGDGLIRVGTDGGQEVNYFLKDHLGSIRVIIDANGQPKERNDYYPFGGVHQRSDYAASANRYKYNGKEKQTTGDLDYLDYGWRMYDAGLGRWFGVDPMGEKYHNQSSYTYCGNNPVLFIDPDGMAYWSTSDPALISAYMKGIHNQQGSYLQSFDFNGWDYASDAEFLNGLTYNDKLNRFFFDYGGVVDGVATRFCKSLPGHLMLDGNIGIQTYSGMDESRWFGRASGQVDQDYTIDASLLPIGGGLGVLGKWIGRLVGKSVIVSTRVSTNIMKPLGLGSTGRTVAKNLTEELSMKEIMSNPAAGKILIRNMTDMSGRWGGWSKMSNKTAHGVEIHYNVLWKNGVIKAIDDFKFIDL